MMTAEDARQEPDRCSRPGQQERPAGEPDGERDVRSIAALKMLQS